MGKPEKIPDFKDEQDLIAFMENHDGFELVDQDLAEIVETPMFYRKCAFELDQETIQLLDELVTAGICPTTSDAVAKAVHSYALAVLPHTYKLVRTR